MKIHGFLIYYKGWADFDPNVVLVKTATDCAKFLGIKLCHIPGCEDHGSAGPHAHIPEAQFGPVEQFPGEVASRADLAGMSFRQFTAKGVSVFWIIANEGPPPVYFREAKLVVGYAKG